MSTLSYYRSGDIIKIIIEDCTGRKIETYKFQLSDKKTASVVMQKLKDKYGFEPTIEPNSFSEEDSWVV